MARLPEPRRIVVTRLALIAVSVVVGAALAVAVAFTLSGVVGSAQPRPVNQQLYNYGSP
jgi:ABC-type arginine/histidine transport system permease subunit